MQSNVQIPPNTPKSSRLQRCGQVILGYILPYGIQTVAVQLDTDVMAVHGLANHELDQPKIVAASETASYGLCEASKPPSEARNWCWFEIHDFLNRQIAIASEPTNQRLGWPSASLG